MTRNQTFTCFIYSVYSCWRALLRLHLSPPLFHSQPPAMWAFIHSPIPQKITSAFFLLSLSKAPAVLSWARFFFLLLPLFNFPDGNLAIPLCRATQDIAILSRAQCLDAVWMGLQLFGHSVALWVHHKHLTSQLTVTLTWDTASAPTTHPYLMGGDSIKEKYQWISHDWSGVCLMCVCVCVSVCNLNKPWLVIFVTVQYKPIKKNLQRRFRFWNIDSWHKY